jgi:hypothetical protein
MNTTLRKKLLFALFITLTLYSYIADVHQVFAEDYGDKESLVAQVSVSNTFTVVQEQPSSYIKNVTVSLNSFPRNDANQKIISVKFAPRPYLIDNDSINFFWDEPSQKNFNIDVDAAVATSKNMAHIREDIPFPIHSLDNNLYLYLQPTAIIDVNSDIKSTAAELTTGSDNLFDAEYRLAEFVRKDVQYDLSSLTAEVEQKSSWVLVNKRGVCDEITNLFISLNRAVGIPARYVSGVAYTNLDIFGTHWVPHAWAEVYFPEYGWVPYDVTYGQYGFIDAAHIRMSDSYDARIPGIRYDYIGNKIMLEPNNLNMSVVVTSVGNNVNMPYVFSPALYDDTIGFGSYNIVEVDVSNPTVYYMVADMYLGNTQGITIIEDSPETVLNRTIHRKEVLLRPKESKKIYWVIKLDDDLQKNFVYTFPVTVYDAFNESKTIYFKARKDYTVITKNSIDDYIVSVLSPEEHTPSYAKDISLECTPDNTQVYINEMVTVTCMIDNQGDQTFSKLHICMDTQCFDRSLAIEKFSFSFNKTMDDMGLKNLIVKVSNDRLLQTTYVPVNVLDRPLIEINDIHHPDIVNFDDDFSIDFLVVKKSISEPRNVKISVQSPITSKEWSFSYLDNDRGFVVDSNGKSMKANDNPYHIIVTYEDIHGNSFTEEKTFTINSHANFFQKIVLWFNAFSKWAQ